MEDILALVLVLAIIGGVIAVGVFAHRYAMRKKKEDEARLAAQRKAAEEYWSKRSTKKPETVNKPVKPAKTETVTPRSTPSTTYSDDRSDDGFLTGMLMGTVLNTVLHNSESHASPGVSVKESDWGLDDSDSRKSISSSMSDSWSSSSSDSWSSSDSGPSSDW